MIDVFEKLNLNTSPLGRYSKISHGYFTFPKFEGEISNKMIFRNKEKLQWSLNNYLGLANHPEVRKADADAAAEYGLAYPMGARMMSGNSNFHEQLEDELAEFEGKESAILLNYGYQGMLSAIDVLVNRKDIIIYDAESHACIIDGVRLHAGKRFVYKHNDIADLEKQLERAKTLAEKNGGGTLVITEGVFGMSGNQGNLKDIVALKEKHNFRLFVDDAHGFGTMGSTGAGTGEAQGCQDGVDLYFGTFAKAMASIGGFIAGEESVINFLKYNTRSQVFAKALPMPLVIGALKRLELLKSKPELRDQMWSIAKALQKGLRDEGFNLGTSNTQVTPVFMTGEVLEAANMTIDLRENFNIFCSIVIYPVVPKDVIMLRLIPTAMHTMEDVEYTIASFKAVNKRLKAGAYKSSELMSDVRE